MLQPQYPDEMKGLGYFYQKSKDEGIQGYYAIILIPKGFYQTIDQNNHQKITYIRPYDMIMEKAGNSDFHQKQE